MKIHFVCSGNTNRSRMAEAYLKSKNLPNIEVSSSGIYAAHNKEGAISWYSNRVLTDEGFIEFAAATWTQTTKELLEKQDFIVCMKQHHFDFIKNELGYIPLRYEIWDIEDVAEPLSKGEGKRREFKLGEDTIIFHNIQRKVDELIASL
jgi:protein-tyrosine-phosphatase